MNDSQFQNKKPEKLEGLADILIVDDLPDNIRFLSTFLFEQGYQVRKAINGKMALRAVETLAPDLILLDINLPDIDGYEVCRRLKQEPSSEVIPIVFLSAGNEAIDKVKAFQMGAVDYITKPFYLEEVLVRIQTQLTIQGLQRELRKQNKQLKQTLEELKIAQENLVQQEKMALLKKVVSGVAHEINNPLSFIACNIEPAKDYISQLITLIKLYQERDLESDPLIKAYLEEIDLEFLTLDLSKILDSMKNGAERISTVILALRIFSRLDESGVKDINLQESIDNVLTMLQHRLVGKDNVVIQIKKEYKNLPLVMGYPDQLNQAIFNLLCNAIDAIDEKNKRNGYLHEVPEISIQAELIEEKRISIGIRDNGIGISEANLSHIFEPFFTTKMAGRGVGLGLTTSQRIIEEIHSGSLTCHSTFNAGSEFIIQLPV